MSESTFGNLFKITTWGESHGEAIGVVIDKVPAGIELCDEDFVPFMLARRPNNDKSSTKRKESDTVHILSGVFEGLTTGTPVSLIIKNEDAMSSSYDAIKDSYRPGHADFSYDQKYGFRDYRGGGRSSGRETATRVAAGVVARKILDKIGIEISSVYSYPLIESDMDSVGGKVTCTIENVPAGLGEPVFDKLDATISHAVMSIGAVKAIEIGKGTECANMQGSAFNDAFCVKDGKITTKTNNAGGILGGISAGNAIEFTAYIKPTPSISLKQDTVTKDAVETEIEIKGRHDKCIVPRVAPVIEAMAAIAICDALLINLSSRIDNIVSFYKK